MLEVAASVLALPRTLANLQDTANRHHMILLVVSASAALVKAGWGTEVMVALVSWAALAKALVALEALALVALALVALVALADTLLAVCIGKRNSQLLQCFDPGTCLRTLAHKPQRRGPNT
jgi:hypothetical protein